ncbi:MAG TPA: rod shape-determining protein MreC [Rhizomicrobium sp.]|nr:rod shape-determining protein MreC [Rhizomicrobium sp.]
MANGFWRNVRVRGDNRVSLSAFALLALLLLLLSRAQVNIFDRARAQISDAAAPWLSKIEAPFDGFNRWVGNLGSIFSVYSENLRLKDENARLRQWQGAAILLQGRVTNYERLLHAVPRRETSSVLAHVIGRSGRPYLQTMILDAGKAEGVRPGEAVLDARGLIGRILVSGNHTSWVIPLKDLNSRVPVTIAPSNAQAILAGNNTSFPGIETFDPRVQIKPGDVVFTSGDGGLLPPGLPIGTIVVQANRYRVALFADANSGADVEVLDFKGVPETQPTPQAADIPAPPPAPAQSASASSVPAVVDGNE